MYSKIRIYDICRGGSRALGPGLRYIIWTQGCLFHCANCLSPQSKPLDQGYLMEVDSIADDIISNQNIEGITISGGEPMIQAEPLCQLLDKVKDKRPELTIISFTGFRKENLTAPAQIQLLNTIDLLIDGEYVDELNDEVGLRGSSNQRLHFMSNRLLPFKEELEHGKRVIEFHIQQDKTVAYGIPKRKMFY